MAQAVSRGNLNTEEWVRFKDIPDMRWTNCGIVGGFCLCISVLHFSIIPHTLCTHLHLLLLITKEQFSRPGNLQKEISSENRKAVNTIYLLLSGNKLISYH